MTRTVKSVTLSVLLCLMLALSFVFGAAATNVAAENADTGLAFSLTSDGEGKLTLYENGDSQYDIIFSSDIIDDYSVAKEVQRQFNMVGGVISAVATPDSSDRDPQPYEILIGQTNRYESKQLLEMLEDECENSDDIAYGYAVIGQKLLYIANSSLAFTLGSDEFLEYLAECEYAPATDLLVIKTKTTKAIFPSLIIITLSALAASSI